jgi:peptidoglycan/LPS O-acetylase OafA/YrhL
VATSDIHAPPTASSSGTAVEGITGRQFNIYRIFNVDDSSSRYRALDGVRAVAISLVFLVHYVAVFRAWAPDDASTRQLAAELAVLGNAGVDLFFGVSGILIYRGLLRSRAPYATFIRRRVVRIYPTFLAVFGLYVGLSIVLPSESKIPADPWQATVYMTANLLLLPGVFPIEPLIAVAWSLSYEFLFYLATPLLVVAFRLRGWNPSARLGFLVAVSALVLLIDRRWSVSHMQMLYFVMGMVVFEMSEARSDFFGRSPFSSLAFTGALVLVLHLIGSGALVGWTRFVITLPVYGGFLLSALRENNPVARMLSLPAVRWLGAISYSYYLMHGLTLKGVEYALRSVVAPVAVTTTLYWIGLVLAFLLTCVSSAALFLLVEQRFSLRRPAADPVRIRVPA